MRRHYSGAMPNYVTLMRWTSQGVAGLPAWRERVEEGERIIEEAGGKLIGVYVTLGRYDVVEIFEAPDDDIAVEVLLKLQRYGAEHTETLRARTPDRPRRSGRARRGPRRPSPPRRRGCGLSQDACTDRGRPRSRASPAQPA